MAKVGNWVSENCTTVGAGDIILAGAISGQATFAKALPAGEVYYSIEQGNDYEAGIGVFDGNNIIVRSQVSSTYVNGVYTDAAPTAINLKGSAIVSCTYNAVAFNDVVQAAIDASNSAIDALASEASASASASASLASQGSASASEEASGNSAIGAALSESNALSHSTSSSTSASDSNTSASASESSSVSAATSASLAQIEAWEAEAEKLTADSYAVEPEDANVKIYASDGDGTFTETTTAIFSALHWAAKSAAQAASGEANTASNLGTGESLFFGKTLVDLQFKSLSVVGASISSTADDITITVSTGDMVSTNNLSDLANTATSLVNLGLDNVDNVSDANKPISTLTQAALDSKQASGSYETADATILKDANIGVDVQAHSSVLDEVVLNGSFPIGMEIMFPTNAPPAGWLEEDGSAISRTTYADLFAVLGTLYGVGDGTTTFNIPDSRGEFIRGWDNGRGVDTGRAIGSFQGDAIRNISGDVGSVIRYIHGSGAFYGGTVRPSLGSGSSALWDVHFDASLQVPTASENRPRSTARMLCIKY